MLIEVNLKLNFYYILICFIVGVVAHLPWYMYRTQKTTWKLGSLLPCGCQRSNSDYSKCFYLLSPAAGPSTNLISNWELSKKKILQVWCLLRQKSLSQTLVLSDKALVVLLLSALEHSVDSQQNSQLLHPSQIPRMYGRLHEVTACYSGFTCALEYFWSVGSPCCFLQDSFTNVNLGQAQ